MLETETRPSKLAAFFSTCCDDIGEAVAGKDSIHGPPYLYDPAKFGIKFLARWQGTVLPLIWASPLFWFLFVAHVINLSVYHYLEGDEPALDWKAAVVPSSLLTFLLVTFCNQQYERYFELYNHCVGMHGAIMEWVGLVKTEFGHLPSSRQWNLIRLVVGAIQVHYAMLGGDPGDDGKKLITNEEWREIRTHNLLTRGEIERLKNFAGFKPFLPVTWALTQVKKTLESGGGNMIGSSGGDGGAVGVQARIVSDAFKSVGFKFRMHSSSTFNTLNAPVPFAYFHVMKLLLLLALLIVSYALVELLEGQIVLSTIVFILTCLVMVGLSEIAIAMSDPFGDDQADFNLNAFLQSPLPDELPSEMLNPIDEKHASLRKWNSLQGSPLIDRSITPMATPRSDDPSPNTPRASEYNLPATSERAPATAPERRRPSDPPTQLFSS